MTGFRTVLSLALRRDRLQLILWPLLFVAMAGSAYRTASSTLTSTDLADTARATNANPSLVAMLGPVHAATPGAVGMLKMTVLVAACLGLLAGLLVIRHSRADEESGRRELLGAGAIDRAAPPLAALTIGVGTSLVTGLLGGVALVVSGADVAGSAVFGAGWTLTGVVYAAIALLCAQLTRGARAARGLLAGGLGAAYLLRAVGDLSALSTDGSAPGEPGWASWLSPLGWIQRMVPFAGDHWWPALPVLALSGALSAAALRLAVGRDLGAGVVPERAGRARASSHLRSPDALARRLHRGQVFGWGVGLFAVGAALGGMGSAIDTLASSATVREMLERLGGTTGGLEDAFYGAELAVIALAVAALGVSIVAGAADDETSGRAEYLLAAPVSRLRWYAGHLIVAVIGTALVSLAAGLGVSLTAGRWLLLPAIAMLPAVWVVTAVAALAVAASPRWVVLGWTALTACLILLVSDVLRLPHRVAQMSPFAHIGTTPGAPAPIGVTAALTIAALVALIAAALGASRRDLRA